MGGQSMWSTVVNGFNCAVSSLRLLMVSGWDQQLVKRYTILFWFIFLQVVAVTEQTNHGGE
jgi:hypothetical protein